MRTAIKTLRIVAGKYYVLARHPGISGFQNWDRLEYSVVTALKARNDRLAVIGELLPVADDRYRLADGHSPDYQPNVAAVNALKWLDANPFGVIVKVNGSKPLTH